MALILKNRKLKKFKNFFNKFAVIIAAFGVFALVSWYFLNITKAFIIGIPIFTTINVTKAGAGFGTVTDNFGAINCGPDCVGNYAWGGPGSGQLVPQVVLTATPDSGSIFNGWSGSCTPVGAAACINFTACIGTINPCQIRAQGAIINTTAPFELAPPPPQTLTVVKNGPLPGDVTVFDDQGQINCGTTCGASYSYNTLVTLIAIEEPFTQFDGWQGAGCTGTGNCVVTMSVARSVTARFSFLPQTLIVTPIGSGIGTITSSPAGINCGGVNTDCSFDFGFGTNVILTATADIGSQFIEWTGDCIGNGACSITMNQPRAVSAQFELTTTNTLNPDLSGWAWSSQIGWLSFNCLDRGVCGQSDYRVEIDPTTGLLNGWAWSSNVGWVQFDALPDLTTGLYPAAPQTPAIIDINTGVFSGWARALTYAQVGLGDGWLQIISGPAAVNLGIPDARRQKDKLVGWAWGGEPIGWLNFLDVSMPSPTCSFAADKKNVAPNEIVNLTWNCQPNNTACSINEGIGSVDPISGSVTDNPTKRVTVYQLTCDGLGTTRSWSVEVKTFQSPRREILPR